MLPHHGAPIGINKLALWRNIPNPLTSPTHQRIPGFDLARAYAIFGMYIVNFNFCFGSFSNTTLAGRFITLFTGNSTSIFIICAGMGLSLMVSRQGITADDKKRFKSIVLKRSWFLLAIGLALYSWWPGDILHFYGGYMHIAAFLMFVPQRYYLVAAIAAIAIYHALLFFIPVETAWDFATFKYADFWTLKGFLRNTLYNGWNSIFPWIAYFMLGMWLGKLNWQNNTVKKYIFVAGAILLLLFEGLRAIATANMLDIKTTQYIMSEYFPPYLPFMAITTGFALMVISACMYIGYKFPTCKLIIALTKTGQMTLTHYVVHITLGMVVFAVLFRNTYTGYLPIEEPVPPIYILGFATGFFILSVAFSVIWKMYFKNGPLEILMRKISG